MDRALLTGAALTVVGVAGYALGVAAEVGLLEPYPGRSFSIAGVMAGLTLVAVGAGRTAGESPTDTGGDHP